LQKERFNWEKQAQAAAAKKTAEADTAKEQLLTQLNVGLKVLNPKATPETNWDAAYARLQMGGADAERIAAYMESGGNSLAVGAARVSGTPAGAISMMKHGIFGAANDPGFEPMKKYLNGAVSRSLVAGVKPAEATANVNATIAADQKVYEANVMTPGSFYAPPALGSILSSESVRATTLYKKVLSTAGKDLTTADPTAIVKLSYEAAKAGTVTYEQAAQGISELYAQAMNINNSDRKYAQVGILPQNSFNTKPDIWGQDVPANLANYSSTLRLLAIMKSREWAAKIQAGGLNLPAVM
jgi:hypothetical protein